MKDLRQAIGFLTVLPVAPRDEAPKGPARAYFPLVGLALGALLACVDYAARQVLPLPVVGALLLSTMLVMTRAIHTEGFLDCCDGLFGGFTRERRLEILRDSHVGAFAVVGGAALVLLKWSLLAGLPDEVRAGLLVVFPCLSRLGMLWTMSAFAYVREAGMGTPFLSGANRWQVAIGTLTAAAASVLLLGAAGAVLLAAAVGLAVALGRWITGLLGGMTGDTYGAVNEVGEVAVMLLGFAIHALAPEVYRTVTW